MDTMLRRRSMIAAGVSPTPPTPTYIPYIRGGGDGSYIDTGITPDQTTKVIVWARNWNPSGSSYTWLFGSRVANQNSMFGMNMMSAASTGKVRISYGDVNTDLADKWALAGHYHKYELSADGFYVDDALVSSVSSATISNNYNIHLFGCNNAGSRIAALVPSDIVACKIYKGGSLVRDFTAVKAPSIGLYDAVSDTVFTNAGSGSFAYGTFNPEAYTPLEYVSCSGSQWFDSGAIATYEDSIVATCMLTNTEAKDSWPFGLYTNNEACAIYFGNVTYRNAITRARLGANTTSQVIDNSTTVDKYSNKKLVLLKASNRASVYYNNTQQGDTVTASTMTQGFSSNGTMGVGCRRLASSFETTNALIGRLYYLRFGTRRNFVAAKVGNNVGMWDTYNDVFYQSETETAFVAGPEI